MRDSPLTTDLARCAPQQSPSPARLRAVLRALRSASFADEQLRILSAVSRTDFFLVAQVHRLLQVLAFSSDRVRALALLAPRLLDPENAFSLYGAIPFGSDQERVRAILEDCRGG